MKKLISGLVLIIALCVFGYSAFVLTRYGLDTKKTIEGLSELTDEIDWETEIDIPEDATPEEIQQSMMAKYGKLYKKNHDFAGWLKIEDTGVDNPVMYTPEDPQHYLRLNFDGEYDIAGMLFIDDRDELDPEKGISTNTIIYGHRMNNNTMFGPLGDYKDDKFIAKHKFVQFDTLYRPGTYEVFAVILSEAFDVDSKEFKYYDFIEASNKKRFNKALGHIKELSIYYDDEAAPVYGDELLTLSTCDYYKEDGRLAVICKRIGNGM